ncbi:DNA-binding response regulator [Pedobacter yulinensis]|uniref:DNA-binding response regulator n=1 Tax=Pedobacter yulinensis TaxID=2126353 RepID=A0A2T3HQD7_9SPHI|nr:LytTR family DNA-binding domain-containing protein [Pedobacter yulinensis]PST84658.1 DNA-binding response regulator [Pedobacter yulinensis]
MIRCLAVDDEMYAAEIIAGYIAKTPFLQLAGVTSDPFEALRLVQAGEIDLVFLDIQMPELTGIQFLKICGGKCKVILTTAYPEYALDGFDLDVIDYLLKPVPYERFYRSALKASQHLEPALPQQPAPAQQSAQPGADYLFIKGDNKNKFIRVELTDILYLEGLKNYVSVYTATQRLITYQSLREFEAQLPAQLFMRIHKSYIVPFGKIRMVDGNAVYIGDNSIPVGETYRTEFFRRIREGA